MATFYRRNNRRWRQWTGLGAEHATTGSPGTHEYRHLLSPEVRQRWEAAEKAEIEELLKERGFCAENQEPL